MKTPQGRIDGVEARLEKQRLKVRVSVTVEKEGTRHAYLPEREVAALLPRNLADVSGGRPPEHLLATIETILARLLRGRSVRLWQWQDRSYASFPPWRNVRFAGPDDDRTCGSEPGGPEAGGSEADGG